MSRTCPSLSLLLVLFLAASAPAADWYVSGSGSDGNAGTSNGSPFLTLGKAAGKVAPGDTVWVMNGTYANANPGWDVVDLTTSGTAGAWITWKAMPGHAPELRFTGWNGFKIAASYQIIDGFIVTGCIDSVTLAQAQADELLTTPSPLYNGTGITVDNRGVAAKAHHITIRNCTVRKCSGGGIQTIQTDYITVEDCLIRDNAWYGRYAQSGLSLYQLWNFDTAAGYHNRIQRNTLCNNRTLVKWKAIDALSDGNGVIIDDSKNTQNGSTLGAYSSRTLVSDNLSVNNGGSGIHTYESEHVDIVNNTAYQNGQVVGYPEIFAGSSNDVRILDNIMFAKNGGKVNDTWSNTNVTYDYNIYYNGTVVTSGSHDVVADPKFASPGLDTSSADFRILAASPALDSGTSIGGVTSASDHDGTARPQGSAIDRGAYERPAGDTTAPTTPAAPTVANGGTSLPTLSGTTEPHAAVLIRDNGVLVATVPADGSGSWTWTPSGALAPGSHAFTVVARDASGNRSAASPASTVVIAAAPAPAASGGGGGGGGGCGTGVGAAGLACLLVLGWRRLLR